MTENEGNAVVTARGLSRSFGSVSAVRNVDFAVARGEIFGLVGPDGAGKTTIMRMLAGVLKPDAGDIHLEGVDVAADPERAKTYLSYMPQRFGLYEDMTVDENIFFYATLFEISSTACVSRASPFCCRPPIWMKRSAVRVSPCCMPARSATATLLRA